MRIPRIKFTIRRLMAVVAVVALAISVLPRIIFQYTHPMMGGASVLYRPIPGKGQIQANLAVPTYPIGQPIPTEATFAFEPGPWMPSGLPYWVTTEIKFTDSTFTTVYQVQRRTYFRITGWGPAGGLRETIISNLAPRQPGLHHVRYELNVTDMFGRTNLRPPALSTAVFTASPPAL